MFFVRVGPSHVTLLSKKYTIFVFGPERPEHCEDDFSGRVPPTSQNPDPLLKMVPGTAVQWIP